MSNLPLPKREGEVKLSAEGNPMLKLLSAAAALCLLGACVTECPDDPPQRQDATYVCEDGSQLRVTFDRAAGRALVSEDGGTALDLPVQISGSGFRYADDDVVFRGNNTGTEAYWTSPAGAAVTCRPVSTQAAANETGGESRRADAPALAVGTCRG